MKKHLLFYFVVQLFLFQAISQNLNSEYRITKTIAAPKFNALIDIDNDGDEDLLVYDDNNLLMLYPNLGNGDFGVQKELFTTSNEIEKICIKDIDNDGFKDIVAIYRQADSLVWYKNTNGNFGGLQFISNLLDDPFDVKSEDLNDDGLPDIVTVSRFDDKIAWYENLGGGIFGVQQVISSNADGARFLSLADLDGDLDVDIAVGTTGDNTLSWYENQGGGAFGTPQIVGTVAGYIGGILTADIDSDSKVDLLMSDFSNEVTTSYRNLGSGNFGSAVNLPGQIYSSLVAEDINQDGFVDILGVSSVGNNWIMNNGSGIFTTVPNGNGNLGSGVSPCIADIDLDGDNDIISSAPGSNSRNSVFWHENRGGGDFGGWSDNKKYIERNPSLKDDLLAIDIDNDGNIDLVAVSEMMIAWHKNLGNGVFSNPRKIKEYFVSDPGGYVDGDDLDNDGDIDLVLGSDSYTGVAENIGNGIFSNFQSFPILVSLGYMTDVITKDLNNDGLTDILFATYGSGIKYVENLGGLSFAAPVTVSNSNTYSLFSVDIDGDFDNDIVAASDNGVSLYENLGSGTFGPPQLIGYSETVVHCADIDNDGDFDIISASYQNDKVVWIENLGSLNFSTEVIISNLTDGVLDIDTGDLDNDGDLEIFTASGIDKKLAVYENLGNGSFGPQQVFYNENTGPTLVVPADFDNDGDLDIASSRSGLTFWVDNDLYNSIQVSGTVYVDTDQNGELSSSDLGINMHQVFSAPSSNATFTQSNGKYNMLLSDFNGQYNISIANLQYWDIVTDSSIYHVNLSPNFTTIDSLNFGLYPNTILDSVSTELVGMFPRCNQIVNYYLNIANSGTTVPSGVIHLKLDDALIYAGAPVQPDSIVGQNIFWSYNNLNYFKDTLFVLQVIMPDFNSIGDTLTSTLTANIVDGAGIQVFEKSSILNQVLVCAYDPNDKISEPEGIDSLGFINYTTNIIDYTVRFQNTGNDTAMVVKIEDQLDENLNWSSLTFLAGSHPVKIKTNQNGKASFIFESINLPDSTTNEEMSHGFIKFRIKVKDGVPIGTQIDNLAQIYFDANPPVITNTKILTLDSLHFLETIELIKTNESVYIYPNPFDKNITIKYLSNSNDIFNIEIYKITGEIVYIKENVQMNDKTILHLLDLERGIYLIRGVDNQRKEFFNRKIVSY